MQEGLNYEPDTRSQGGCKRETEQRAEHDEHHG